MPDAYELLAEIVIAIREDNSLKDCFTRILGTSSSNQDIKVTLLYKELQRLGAPPKVQSFVKLLSNEELAKVVLRELQK